MNPTVWRNLVQVSVRSIAAAALLGSAAWADVIYVKAAETCSTPCGSSWASACACLQDALDQADVGDEIWAAEGEYLPDKGSGRQNDDREEVFHMPDGVAIYGGFVGDEDERDERDWLSNVTILSGDIDEDGPDAGDSYHVVVGAGASESATGVLDGFTIKEGNASATDFGYFGAGAGYISCAPSGEHACSTPSYDAPTIRNCTFTGNRAGGSGGAMELRAPSLVESCVFTGNQVAGTNEAHGGAIYVCCNSGAATVVKNSIFYGNTAARWGGAVSVGESDAQFINCLFYSNSTTGAYTGGGGAIWVGTTQSFESEFINCTLSGNTTTQAEHGGGILLNAYNSSTGPDVTITNCILWGNTGPDNPEPDQIYNEDSTPNFTVANTDVEGCSFYCNNSPHHDNIGDDPDFVSPGNPGYDYRLSKDSPAIDVADNSANSESYDLVGNPRIRDYVCNGEDASPVIDMGAYEFRTGIVYVDSSAPGEEDGASWEDAWLNLQSGLTDARNDDEVCQVRVAVGTYKPNSCVTCTGTNREDSFELINGIEILGGYKGNSGTGNPDDRDVDTYETILSGSLATGYNAYHVVSADDTIDETAVLDGFTVQLGIADGADDFAFGGGIFIDGGAPTINDCTVTGNSADRGGGAYLESDSQAVFTDCVFEDNTADNGGGMFIFQSKPTLTACNFTANDAPENGAGTGQGAGVYVSDGTETYDTDPVFTRCRFNSNLAELLGGGVFVDGPGGGGITAAEAPVFVNCLFYSNEATDGSTSKGGGIYCERTIELYSCTLARNKTGVDDTGGGIYNFKGDSVIKNCILWRNRAATNHDDEPDQIYVAAGTLAVTNTCIENLDTWPGDDNTADNPEFTDLNGDNYILLSTDCDPGPCESEAIDGSDNSVVNCGGGDFRGASFDRCVELEGHGDDADMGCYETQG